MSRAKMPKMTEVVELERAAEAGEQYDAPGGGDAIAAGGTRLGDRVRHAADVASMWRASGQ